MLTKMLRATLSKLKKVCFETLTPRIFRGDYYIPVCTTRVSRAHKSTDAGKGSKDEEDEKCKKLIDEIFPEGPKASEDPSVDLSNIQELKREQITPIVSPNVITPPETECQICEKLIAQAFGKDGDDNKLPNDAIVSATTAKQTEEQLAQKLEMIDETPLVEAEKPNIEGFNVNPKVLGAEENVNLETLNFDKSEGKDGVPVTVIDEKMNNDLEELCQKIERGNRFYHAGKNLYNMLEFKHQNCNPMDPTYTGITNVSHPYDDIAKRCISIPSNKIDRHILRELQRLGVPHSSGYASNTDNTGNVDDLRKQMNYYNLQRGNFEDPPPDDQVINSPHEHERLQIERSVIYELDKKPMPLCMMEQNVIDDTIMTLATVGPKPEFNPNRMLLDPFDKKSLCYDCVDPEYEKVSYEKVHVLVQRLENKNYIEQTDNFQTTEATYAEQSKQQTQSAEETQSYYYVKPEYQGYVIKPLNESPRLPERPVNCCNENFPIHPLNREHHYSMEPFQESQELHNQMNYQENMVPNQQHQHGKQQNQREHHQQHQHEYHVNTSLNHQNQQQYYWNRDLQNQTNYYGNRFQGGEQHHQTTPQESPPNINLPHEQQSNIQTPAVHVFTNSATNKLETLETVLPHKENITTEEVSEHIKQQTSKQVGNISEENIASESAEKATISQQYYFNEQNPRQVQFFQPAEQEQSTEHEHLDRPFEPTHVSLYNNYGPFDLRSQPVELTKAVGTTKAHQEQLDNKEQPTEQAQVLGSVKVHSEQLDKKEQPTEEVKTLHSEQLDKKEQPTEQAQLLGSVKVNSEQLDKKEQPTEKVETLHSEQLDNKEQPTEQAQLLGSVKVHSEQLDKKEQPTKEVKTLHSEQLDKKEQPTEQAQLLGSVKVHSEQLDKKEHPTEQAQVLGSVKVHSEQLEKKEQPTKEVKTLHSEQLDKKEQPTEQAQLLASVKVHSEQLDKKEQPTEEVKTLHSEQFDKKEQLTEQAQIRESVKAHQGHLYKQERPIEHKVLNYTKAQDAQLDLRKQPIEQPEVFGAKVLGSVKADQKQHKDNKEQPIERTTFLASVSAHQERLQLEKQANERLKILETYQENLKKTKRSIEDVELLSSSKPQERLDDLKKQPKEATVLGSVKIQEAPEEKAEQIQQKPKSEDPNDEFKKKLSSTIIPLPKLNTDEKLPLSVLLKRLRERSKIESCHDLINPVGKKCGCPPPPCPPPAPTCPPPKPCPPPPCPPPPSPCPKPCKPACPSPCGPPKPLCPPKKPSCKYIQVDTDFDFAAILRETDVYLKKQMYETVTAILTKEVIMRLEKMGVSLLITNPNEEIDLDNLDNAGVIAESNIHNLEVREVNSTGVDLARDYEPWVPIPSWPIPRKVKKRPLVCPKDGCKIIPPPRLNPPCNQNPCIGFPKRKNSFSTTESPDLSEHVNGIS